MNKLPELVELVDGVIEAVKDYLARNLGGLVARVKALEDREPVRGEKGEPGVDGKSVDPADVERMVKAMVDALPAAKDGADGKDADAQAITDTVLANVTKALDAIPAPKDGRDGKSVDIEEVKALVAAEVAAIEKPKDGIDGKDADAQAIFADVMDRVTKALDAIPAPKDGRDGLQGDPGRDALAIDVLDMLDHTKRYQRGTYAHHRGGVVRAFRVTDPLEAGADVEKSGWHVVLNGIDSEDEQEHEDGRIVERSTTYTNGKTLVRRSVRGVLLDRGIFKQGDTYAKGDVTTWDGSMWIAQKATDDKPGTSDAWRLSVKRGRDGRDGLKGEKGERGSEGRAGKDMTQMGFDGKKF